MNVTAEEITRIKPGAIEPFICENGRALHSAASLVTWVKRMGFPEGVVDYETQKFYNKNIILIHALGEGEEKVLNK